MQEPLTIAVVQPRCTVGAVAANVAEHAAAIGEAASRLVVFPELSLTGYAMNHEPIDPTDDRLVPIVAACAASRTVALVGAPVHGEGGRRHIAVLAVDGDGVSVAYRKMFLGGDEPANYAPGLNPAVIDVDGWRLGLAICKDTDVAEHAAALAARGMDAYVGGVCETADDRGEPSRRAGVVADRFGVWVALASFAGPTGGGFDRTAGGSGVWRPDGSAAAELGDGPGGIGRAILSQVASPSC